MKDGNQLVDNDFKIIYKSIAIKEHYGTDMYLKNMEEEAKEALLKGQPKISDFIELNNKLENQGMKFVKEIEIRKTTKEDRKAIKDLYRDSFTEFGQDFINCVDTNFSIGIYEWGKLMGVITYNKFQKHLQTCAQILLFGVWTNQRRKGYGSRLMEHFMYTWENIAVLSDLDDNVISFYTSRGFREDPILYEKLKDSLQPETDSLFMARGFNFLEDEIPNMGDSSFKEYFDKK